MVKRNKAWRRQQLMFHWNRRLQEFTAYSGSGILTDEGDWFQHPHWWYIAATHWGKVYKTTGTPCSCWMCQGESYDRRDFKKDTARIIRKRPILGSPHETE